MTNQTILLTVQEIANQLRVSESTIYRLVKDHKISCIRIGKQLRFNLQKVKKINDNSKI